MIKVDVCSDLHVDAWTNQTQILDPMAKRWMGKPHLSTFVYLDWAQYKNPDSQVLIIAGDIGNSPLITVAVLEAAAAEYEYVIVVDGNHDHYDSPLMVESGGLKLAESLKPFPNVHLLNGENGLLIDGVAFFGVTGWYDWKAYEHQGISEHAAKAAWSKYSNDSRYNGFECGSAQNLAMIQAVNLSSQVRTANTDDSIDQIVLTTHMSPRADLMQWKAHDPVWNVLTPSYVNTAMNLVVGENTNNKISHWIYGHTHARQVVEKDGIQYINNARGYPNENPPFSLTQIEVGRK